jgi:cytoskeletal protein CcmA (bactofilin family)
MQNLTTADATSLISRNARIEGDIRGNENINIEGHIKGSIKLNGDVFVAASGVVEADIEAANVYIEGKVIGNIKAYDNLEIQSCGKMTGDITARSIDIKEGSTFEGRSHMIKSDPGLGSSTETDNE